MSKDQLSGSPLDEALRLLEAGEPEACFHHVREHWLANPDDAEAAKILCRLFTEAGASELALSLEKLVEEPDAVTSDPNKLFEAGYHLIDHRQFELAAMLLKRCLTVEPDDPTLNYELAYALMSLGRYREAIPLFERAAAEADDFDVRLNLAVCYGCTRDIGRARRMIDLMSKLVEDDEQKDELAHRRLVIRRLEALSDKASLTARDWMYAQYGSVLVTQPGESGIPGP
ncbi:MAG TPA: tetratricopeptide repeat protein, partial [Candidatus Obscuribacterales bacterium]